MKKIFLSLFVLCLLSYSLQSKPKWIKGNTHTHSTYSDGDSKVEDVVKWYHDNAYNFLFITDHNYPLNPDTIKKDYQVRNDFILLPGNEVSDIEAIHVSALNTTDFFPTVYYYRTQTKPLQGEEIPSLPTIKYDILNGHANAIRKAGGLPIANHPNFSSGLQVSDILPAKDIRHLELFNGHPFVYNWGNNSHSAVETKWDSLLISGKICYGLASDDTHHLQKIDREHANPGRGWIMVNSPSLTSDAIMAAIETGSFYASNGVILKDYQIKNKTITVEIDSDAVLNELKHNRGYAYLNMENAVSGYKIEFIGYNGKILKSENALKAKYTLKTEDKYVRVRLSYTRDKDGNMETYFAWTQPVEAEKGFFH